MKKKEFDSILLFCVIALLSIGVIMVYSASAVRALDSYNDSFYYLKRHLVSLLIGILAFIAGRNIKYTRLKSIVPYITLITLLFLSLVFFPPFGREAGGAFRWLDLGIIRFQPSELAKFTLVLYFSSFFVKKVIRNKDFNIGYLPHLFILGFFSFLFVQEPDLGTTIIVAFVSFVLFLSANIKPRYIFASVLFTLPFLALVILKMPYALIRIKTFLSPANYSSRSGFQLIQSLAAIIQGGCCGQGPGVGKQKLFYLPEPHTDFIFSVLAEELGFLGAITVISLFFIIALRGWLIYRRCPDPFGKYLALGLTLNIFIQAMVNIAVVSGLLPTTGLTLPFISFGGSSLVVSLGSVGVLLNISEYTQKGLRRKRYR